MNMIKNIAFALLIAALVFGVGRGWHWLTGTEEIDGLSGPVQVLNIASEVSGIGGYSGLIMAADGTSLRAASDQGFFLDAQVKRTEAGYALGLEGAEITPVLSRKGEALEPFHADLEGITPLPNGAMGLAYESYTRLLYLPPADAQGKQIPKALHGWQKFEAQFGNYAFEAIATLPSGDMIAILELKPDPATAQAYVYSQDAWRGPHTIPAQSGWSISGADLGPDGCLYLVERRLGLLRGFQTQLVRLRGSLIPPFDLTRRVLWRSAPLRAGNGEGVSVWQNGRGTLIASIVTDDGFPPAPLGHPTRLIELPLQAVPDCWDQ